MADTEDEYYDMSHLAGKCSLDEKDADEAVAKLRERGFDAYIREGDDREGLCEYPWDPEDNEYPQPYGDSDRWYPEGHEPLLPKKGQGIGERVTVRVHLADGNYWDTRINCTLARADEYYRSKRWDSSSYYEPENLVECVRVERLQAAKQLVNRRIDSIWRDESIFEGPKAIVIGVKVRKPHREDKWRYITTQWTKEISCSNHTNHGEESPYA
jgi:hypothetical protein